MLFRDILMAAARGGGGFDGDALLWQAAVVGAGGTVSATQLGRISDLVRNLKGAGVWTLLDRLWLFAAENSTQALTDLVSRSVATATNSPTFTANQGYAGNGTSSYVNTGFIASTHGVNYTLNSAHMALYNRTARTDKTGAHRNAGAYGAGGVNAQINLFSFGHLFDCVIHGTGGLQVDAGFADTSGLFTINRSASTTSQGYRNGVLIDTDAATADGLPSSAMYVGAVNSSQVGGSSPIDFVTDQHAMFSVGGSLDATKQAAFYSIAQSHMTAIGAQV